MLLAGPDRAASAAAQATFVGLLLGVLRQGSGSLLAPILAAVADAERGVAFVAASERLPIQGFTGPPGEHTPLWILVACAAPVALAVWLSLRDERGRSRESGGDTGALSRRSNPPADELPQRSTPSHRAIYVGFDGTRRIARPSMRTT